LTADEVNDNADAWLSEQVGHPADALTDEPRFALELAERLTLQWPSVVVTVEQVAGWMRDTLAELGGTFSDAALFHARFLARVHRHDPRVNPYYYDLPGALVAAHCPEAPPPCGPPSEDFIEEPPFVCVRPWRSATAEEMASMPLVIKTPSNVYRLDALRALFPAARLRIVHLVRNPAGSINGLIDGWLHHGFFSHQVDLRLGIRGYSDRFPEWGGSWWKFDLPPGWESCRKASLVEVCAYQWRAAHEAILSFLERNPDISSECLRFEDLVGSAMRRGQAASAIGAWMGLPDDDACLRTLREGLPPVMATTAPRRRRWEQRASELLPVLQHPDVMEMVERLGYADDPAAWE